MGVCTSLVSDSTEEWFDLGKIFFEEKVAEQMRKLKMQQDGSGLEQVILAALRDDSFNFPGQHNAKDADTIVAWMRSHPDWRFLTDQDEEFDDIYLAEDKDDAEDYDMEYGDDDKSAEIYMKTGSVGED